MPATSKQQQKFFGLALSVKRGDTPRSEVSDDVLKVVDTMSEKEIEKYAGTEHTGLPTKKEEVEDIIRQEVRNWVRPLLGEGRAFINAARKAKEEGKTEFEFNGKTYPVTLKEEVLNEMNDLEYVGDQLVNGVGEGFMSRNEFVKLVGKETKYDKNTLGKIYDTYLKLDGRNRVKLDMTRNMKKFLNKMGLKESVNEYYIKINEGATSLIKPGDKVTIRTPQKQLRSGKVVMKSSHGGWVLNMGGAHGRPGVVDDKNIVKVMRGGKTIYSESVVNEESLNEANGEFVVFIEKDNGRKKLLHTKKSQRAANMFLTKNVDKILNTSGIRSVGSMSKDQWEKTEARFAENIKKSGMRTVTRKEWDRTHKDFKGMIKGQPHMMYLDKKTNVTKYGPVQIKESVSEGRISKTFKFPKTITTSKFDEIDADLSRMGIKSEPDFNSNTIRVSGDERKIMKIVNKYKGIEESVNEEIKDWGTIQNVFVKFLQANTKILDKKVKSKDEEGTKKIIKGIIAGLTNAQRSLKLESVNEAEKMKMSTSQMKQLHKAYDKLSYDDMRRIMLSVVKRDKFLKSLKRFDKSSLQQLVDMKPNSPFSKAVQAYVDGKIKESVVNEAIKYNNDGFVTKMENRAGKVVKDITLDGEKFVLKGNKYVSKKGGKDLHKSHFGIKESVSETEKLENAYNKITSDHNASLQELDDTNQKSSLVSEMKYSNQTGIKSSVLRDNEFSNLLSPKEQRWARGNDVKIYKDRFGFIFTDGKKEMVFNLNKPYSVVKPMGNARSEIKKVYQQNESVVNEGRYKNKKMTLKQIEKEMDKLDKHMEKIGRGGYEYDRAMDDWDELNAMKKKLKKESVVSEKKVPKKGSADYHQHKIAVDTVKNPNKSLMGGPSAKEAEEILMTKFGYSKSEISKLKK